MADSIESEGYSIKPQKHTPALDTSEWPLLLKVCILYSLKFKQAQVYFSLLYSLRE
jgi:hypothetical protein